ncbi:MAG TPA: hypothetical protein VK742_14280 [Candidatus Sulfotelmatobacter sp.]|nr:hypothetical protein [Candidatus Sulfotelmatobacter sp.]
MQTDSRDNSAAKFFSPARFGIFLALLVFAEFPQVVLGVESFVARDFGFFAYPLAHFQRDCFWRGEIPFWNPYNNCGVPFLAQWNTMPLYPPSLLYLVFPLNWALSFFSLAHLWWAGLGMYFLARRWTKNDFAAAFAGTVFSFNGFTLNLLMWPSHIATFSWMPWLILCAEAAWREGGRKTCLAAMVGALQMLAGGPETIFLTWLVAAAFWLQQFIAGDTPRAKMAWRFPLLVLLVIALSAAQLFPFLDLVTHAQRESGYTDLRWSMPGFGLANFLVPMAFGSTPTEGIFFQHGQYWTSSYYLGMGTLWLACLALVLLAGRDAVELKSKIKLLLFISVIGLLCALGGNTPFYPLVRKIIPQLSFITYPIKFVMVVVFATPLLAAIALANLEKLQKRVWPIGAALFVALVGILYWTQHAPLPGDDPRAAFMNGISRAGFLILTGAMLWLWAKTSAGKTNLGPWASGSMLLLVAWVDVFTHEPKQNPTVRPDIFAQNLTRSYLKMNPQPELGGARAMLSPQAALQLTYFAANDAGTNFLAKRAGYCANANLLDGVPKVDGFFSLTPREFDNLLTMIYSSEKGDWSRLEDFMGVAQTSSATNLLAWQPRNTFLPLVTAGQKPVFVFDFRFPTDLGVPVQWSDSDSTKVVYLEPSSRREVTVSNQTDARILNTKFGDNTVEIQAIASEPSLVVVAQTFYHNWQATIDGNPAKLLLANMAFQAVQIPAGRHSIHLFYRDRAFEAGALIAGVGWIGSLSALLIFRRRKAG